ncbi:MAG: hypothetical protein GY858_08860 [Candidatus Omnitrophica bacterium]|nr:hypothetical protein [Candidatus Omnitrophota bacterium]
MKVLRKSWVRNFVLAFVMLVVCGQAYADLESGLETLQDKIRMISVPLCVIFLVVAGWQKMSGRGDLFIAALIGAMIVFAAPQIIEMFQAIFGS